LPSLDERPGFTEHFRQALGSQERFKEKVHVAMLIGRVQ
jgi:hypothetical protein